MTESELLLKTKIHYYCREKYYHSMQRVAVEGIKRYSGDPVYRLYFGISLIFEGRLQEGIRELDVVKESKDVALGGILALILAHKRCSIVDKEAVAQLDAQLKETRKQAGEKMLYYAGLFLFLTRRYDKAKEYIDRMLKVSPPTREGNARSTLWKGKMFRVQFGAHEGLRSDQPSCGTLLWICACTARENEDTPRYV